MALYLDIYKKTGYHFKIKEHVVEGNKLITTFDKIETKTLSDVSKELDDDDGIGGINHEFSKDYVEIEIETYKDKVFKFKRDLILISRSDAMALLEFENDRIRDYELEMMLHEQIDIGMFIDGICPYNGFSIVPKEYLS